MSDISVNQNLDICRDDIRYLWETGHPTEDALGLYGIGSFALDYIRSKRSNDGRWYIKLDTIKDPTIEDLSTEEICNQYDSELDRLKNLGLNVISYARAIFPDRKNLTLTPWMEDVQFTSSHQYNSDITPKLKQYYKGWLKDYRITTSDNKRYYIVDITIPEQFTPISSGETVLHDLDPLMSKSPSLARNLIRILND
jgi:hypothetical protein